jgi:hypothetical protein
MVETKITLSPSIQKIRDRVERIRKLAARPGIRVVPRDDDMRRLLKHPRAGGFRSEGSLEWPDDTFTQRRLRDGSVKAEEHKGRGAIA